MKRSEVSAKSLQCMGYKAMVEYTSWNAHTEKECNDQQAKEMFELVVNTVKQGGKIEIRRNHVRGTVIVHIDGTYRKVRGAEFYYFLQRPMSEAEIMEESIRSGLWITRK